MDPYTHTIIATLLVAGAYYAGRYLGGLVGFRLGYEDGSAEGGMKIIKILHEEGTFDQGDLEEALDRWIMRNREHYVNRGDKL